MVQQWFNNGSTDSFKADLPQKITSYTGPCLAKELKAACTYHLLQKVVSHFKKMQRYSEIREVLDLFRTGVSTMHWCTVSPVELK